MSVCGHIGGTSSSVSCCNGGGSSEGKQEDSVIIEGPCRRQLKVVVSVQTGDGWDLVRPSKLRPQKESCNTHTLRGCDNEHIID